MDFETYLSPFTWRYGSQEMRQVWSETNKRRIWRHLWVTLAEVQADYGLVTPEQTADLRAHQDGINISRALEIESQIHHDLMAELKTFAEQATVGGRILHLGATSTDIEDNADALRIRESLDIIQEQLRALLHHLSTKIILYADVPLIAFTHLQPAEPSTLGYRFASWAQELLEDWQTLQGVHAAIRGKGFKGAVGTGAAFAELLDVAEDDRDQVLTEFETALSERLGLPFYPITTQTYPRSQEYRVISALAGLAGSLYKFAFDLRLLQSPTIGELSESFGTQQVGSSAMPFKRNPITSEKIDSLARALAGMPRLAWDNAAHSLLERTLDDSANRRTLLPEAFLTADELLTASRRVIEGLVVDEDAMQRNLSTFGPFTGIERLLMALVIAGADRQEMHERLRQHAMNAWQFKTDHEHILLTLISQDEYICNYIPPSELVALLDGSQHTGNAPDRAREMGHRIAAIVGESDSADNEN